MKIDIEPGTYVVAVSGGVDSMVLLDLLRQLPGLTLVVAHFEHGIREDSDEDRKLVEATAKQYKLPFVCEHGNLGAGASEATARNVRYDFLRRVQAERGAQAIITAHHQDDLLETAVINMLRGTGRKGLSSLAHSPGIVRPLLHVDKQAILAYAQEHHIVWHEDSTNASDAYLRNYIRHHVMPRLGKSGRSQLLGHVKKAQETNPIIDALLSQDLATHSTDGAMDKEWFIELPYDISCEVMATWLRQNSIRTFDRKTIERLVAGAKTVRPGKLLDVNAGYFLKVNKANLQLTSRITS
jgi:tRNA(Ile)-lysidine synthase